MMHAKTTKASIRRVLRNALYCREPFCLIVSDTHSRSTGIVKAILFQIENNPLIREYFQPKVLKKNEDLLIIETVYGRSQVASVSTRQSIRGLLDATGTRPTEICCDDLEEDKRIKNPELREQDWQWFWKVLLPARAKGGKVRVFGSILSKESLLKRLVDSPDWQTLVYSAEVSPGETLWPELMDWDKLMTLKEQYREAGQIHTYYCEYMNSPIDREDAEFKEDWIQIVSLNEDTRNKFIVTSTVDLAISKSESACYTSIVTCGWGFNNPPTMFVLDVRRGRWGVYETIENMFRVKHAFGTTRFGIEKVAYQAALKEVFSMEQTRRQDFVNIELLPAVGAKEERIRALHAMYARGQVKWASDFPVLREEHMSFPNGVTKDCIDAEAYQPKLYAVSPRDFKLPSEKGTGGALIDSVLNRAKKNKNYLGAY